MEKLIIANNETRSQAEFDKTFEADYEPYGIHLNKVSMQLSCSKCTSTCTMVNILTVSGFESEINLMQKNWLDIRVNLT